jgi:succinoglycan biosynthesis transport protein ExoP
MSCEEIPDSPPPVGNRVESETPSGRADRRHLPLSPGVGRAVAVFFSLLVAGAAAVAVWQSFAPKYRAASLLRVASGREPVLFDTGGRASDFALYRDTQRQYFKSRFVLVAALRQAEIARLSALQGEPDAVAWLQDHLEARFPGEAEIMEVSLATEDPEEAAALVNAAVQAYMTEVVDVERAQPRLRLSELDDIYVQKETELRSKRAALDRLAAALGTGDSESLNLKRQLALQRVAALQRELASVQSKLTRSACELKAKEAVGGHQKATPVSDAELDDYAGSDPLIRGLSFQAELLNYQLIQAGERGGMDAVVKEGDRYNEHLREIDRKIRARREELRKELAQKKHPAADEELARLRSELAILTDQEKQLGQEVQRSRQDAEKLGGSSIDVDMLRAEARRLEDLLNTIAQQREKLTIELGAKPRISVVQAATIPAVPEPNLKLPVTAGAAGGAFTLSLCVIWLGRLLRRRRRARPACD